MISDVMCSYCLRSRSETGRLVASPLAAICRQCAEAAVVLFDGDSTTKDIQGPAAPWDRMADMALLARLPEVAAAGAQVEEHLQAWVTAARERGISWAKIGDSLNMTRQSAWERFAKAK